jgi:hypothetical protein
VNWAKAAGAARARRRRAREADLREWGRVMVVGVVVERESGAMHNM